MSAKVTLQDELAANEAQGAEIRARIAQAAHAAFPTMVYKDLEGDGDVSSPSNQHTVKDEAELKLFLKDGWSQDPTDASGKEPIKGESFHKLAEKAAEKPVSVKAQDRADDKADEAKFERDSDRAASKKKGR